MSTAQASVAADVRAGCGRVTREDAVEALARVRDPELDEPITDLGFVTEVDVEGDVVSVRLRLPTYFCAPNFAFLMVADARAALRSVAGVREATVRLEDHFSAREINDEVAGDARFEGAFPGLAGGELGELRTLFDRKALIVRQERLSRRLIADGSSAAELARLRLAELPAIPETDAYLERRARLGLDLSADSAFLVRPSGEPIGPSEAAEQLRFARTVRVSIEGNADMCRGLLRTRYGLDGARDRRRRLEGARA